MRKGKKYYRKFLFPRPLFLHKRTEKRRDSFCRNCPGVSLTSWTWRESNPRPNEEIISFLHAYLCRSFRAAAEPKPSTATLSSKDFADAARPMPTISDMTAPLNRNASEPQLPSDVSFQHLVPELSSNLLYFDYAARA